MPNDDLISRKDLQKAFERESIGECGCCKHVKHNPEGCALIDNAPAVDAEPVRRARLLSTGYDEAWCEWGNCTNCGISNIIGSKRCCECGAYLEEER